MAVEWDPALFVNLVLSIVIVVLGAFSYKKSGSALPLYIAAAFGLFAISHAATLAGLKDPLTVPLLTHPDRGVSPRCLCPGPVPPSG